MSDSNLAFHPSSVLVDLTEERLQFLAALFVRCRSQALLTHAPGEGEDAWCLGCRSYARICSAITDAAQNGQGDWLGVLQARDPGRQFIFTIGKVPFRFYTGNPAKPTARTRRIDDSELNELKQMTLALADGSKPDKWYWRVAIGVTVNGEVGQVCVLQVTTSGSVRHAYQVPFDGAQRLENLTEFLPPGVALDSPDVDSEDDSEEGTGGTGHGH